MAILVHPNVTVYLRQVVFTNGIGLSVCHQEKIINFAVASLEIYVLNINQKSSKMHDPIPPTTSTVSPKAFTLPHSTRGFPSAGQIQIQIQLFRHAIRGISPLRMTDGAEPSSSLSD